MRFRQAITVIGLIAAFGLASCSATPGSSSRLTEEIFSSAYGKSEDAGYALPAIPIKKIDKRFHRQTVRYQTTERRGTIIVDTSARHLYIVLQGGQAIRYGIAVGKDGFRWAGMADVSRKVMWPKWTPPPEMIKRKPELAQWKDGMPGGPKNPLGARALYLFRDGRDTGYRIHGTTEPASIGKAASSGCIRMFNVDVIELYRRTPVGSRVLVYSEGL